MYSVILQRSPRIWRKRNTSSLFGGWGRGRKNFLDLSFPVGRHLIGEDSPYIPLLTSGTFPWALAWMIASFPAILPENLLVPSHSRPSGTPRQDTRQQEWRLSLYWGPAISGGNSSANAWREAMLKQKVMKEKFSLFGKLDLGGGGV